MLPYQMYLAAVSRDLTTLVLNDIDGMGLGLGFFVRVSEIALAINSLKGQSKVSGLLRGANPESRAETGFDSLHLSPRYLAEQRCNLSRITTLKTRICTNEEFQEQCLMTTLQDLFGAALCNPNRNLSARRCSMFSLGPLRFQSKPSSLFSPQ
jgi:hypothetical protein